MRILAAADPSGVAAKTAAERLRTDAERSAHDISVLNEACGLERAQLGQKRQAVHRLQAEALKLRRELAAAERVEATAAAAAAAEANGGSGPEKPLPMPAAELPLLNTGRSVSKDAVIQQGKQLAWRCQEIRELEEKIHAAQKARTKRRDQGAGK